MDFLELVKSRQSDRAFIKGKKIEQEALDYILETARLAPSACNGQPWHFTVVTEDMLLENVAKATSGLGMNKFVKDAAALILITHEPTNFTSKIGCGIKDKDFPMMDLGIATSHIVLAAEYKEVGSCILGWFDEDKIKELVSIPKKRRLMLVVALGYAAKEKRKKVRKDNDRVISFNKYSK